MEFSSLRWMAVTIRRALAWGVPVGLFVICMLEFHRQNHSVTRQQGEFFLVSDAEMMAWDRAHNHEDEPPEVAIKPERAEAKSVVASKYIFQRRGGFTLFGRGHDSSFEAEIPEFNRDSVFIRQLNRQLRREFEQKAPEFGKFDGSVVWDGLRDPPLWNQNWTATISVDVIHVSDSAVCILENYWQYTGGAHGNYAAAGRCFVEQRGEVQELKLEDLFDPASHWEQPLSEMCREDLIRQRASYMQLQEDSDVKTIVVDLTTEDLTSFTLSPKGVRFYFSPYHVGSYAEGMYVVFLPYSAIRELLPESIPAWRFTAKR